MWKVKCNYSFRYMFIQITAVIVTVVLVAAILCCNSDVLGSRLSFSHTVQDNSQVKLNVEVSTHDYHSKHGYVAALRYSGQQGTGIQALMSLQCFVGSFKLPMYIIEPIMKETSFGSQLNPIHNFNSIVKFSDLFDFSHFNNASRKMKFAEIRSENDFFTNAPTHVILVESNRSNMLPASVVWSSHERGNCYTDKQIPRSFCIVRVISVTGKKDMRTSYQIFSEEELLSIIFGPWLPKDVILVFRQWHTPWYVYNPSIENPLLCKNIRSVKPEIQFHTSLKLLNDVERYEDQFLHSKNKLAIMFRLERMIILLRTKRSRKSAILNVKIRKCLNKVENIVNDVWNKRGYLRPLVTLDVGKHGSKSWSSQRIGNVTQEINSTFSVLFQNKWTFSDWEESFTQVASIVNSNGYIAALQRTLASRADCLILVGGGYFQELALNDYKRNHPDKNQWCIHLVCAIYSKTLEQDVDGNVVNKYDIDDFK